ncbi:Uncharacterized protein FWK35_00033033 [Aphis craccivora]|uniref:MULE domain-containing protein n=1 Tax=Aphis craccivora TaxID=307492 RepID=A0A6G0VU68_APHCR|nr:Uncharacterized protein FWK35_00033033 [Aphis craccivora]
MRGTLNNLKLLTYANTWYADGNFGLAPKHLSQLYIIRIEKYIYEKNNLFPDPQNIKIDFEKAVINAEKNELEDYDFNEFCGMLDSLAFLPINRLQEGVDYLKSIIPLGAEELFQYFDEIYVSGTIRRINKQNTLSLSVRRFSAMFPPETWNVHQTTLENNHRTNNVCESWNNRFCHLVGGKHPSIWTLITKIKNELSADRAKFALQNIGKSKTKCSKSKTVQKRLKTLCERLNTNQIEKTTIKLTLN